MHICIVMWLKSWGSVKVVTQCVVCVTLFLTKCSFSLAERTTYDVNLAGAAVGSSGWWQELTRPGPRRRWLEAAAESGLGQESPAGPGRDTSSTSHIDPRNCAPSPSHISSSDNKVMRKELILACLSELRRDWNGLCEQPGLVVVAECRVHILVPCYWLSDVTARLAAAELTNSVSRCYTAAHLTVGWLGLCDEAVKKLVNSQAFSRFRK